MITRLAPTLVALLSFVVSCDAKPPEPTGEPKAKADTADATPDEPKPDSAEGFVAPAGYVAHLADALKLASAGSPVATAETKAWGCSVKYAGEAGPASAKLGAPAPAFSLPDLDGKTVALADFAGKTVVVEWFNPDCPFVKYAHGPAGPLRTMAAEQSGDVVWLAVNSGAPGKQGAGVERNREAKTEYAIEHPILLDESGAVGHQYGATNTPHMFVIDSKGVLVYAGGLDNAPMGTAGE